MRNKLLQILAVILIIGSLVSFLYPNISKLIVRHYNDNITNRFASISEDLQDGDRDKAVEDGIINDDGYLIDNTGEVISDYPVVFSQDINRLHADSISYNEMLREHQDMDCDFSQAVLDLSDYGIYDGVYGYISAPAIGMNVPIYLGASDSNMAYGAAHLMNTSLPLGSENTNAVFAGHTGYFGRTVFDYLPYMNFGDTVSVTTFFDTLDYRVISSKEIGATYTNDIYLVKGKDLLTLITCADRGQTRYEVICERA